MRLIRFFSDTKQYLGLGQPQPMKNFIPEWYRTAESSFIGGDGKDSPGLKTCAPYMDTLLTGYTLVTPVDIYVSKNEDGSLKLGWNGPDSLGRFVDERPKALGATMPRPAGHYPNHLVWSGIWGVKTPKKYSILMTHPLNRFDLPFTTSSGIIDSDEWAASGNIPFFIKEDFVGVIPAGTPFCQIIPIKRAAWKMISNDAGLVDLNHTQGEFVRKPDQSYKKTMWHRKDYS